MSVNFVKLRSRYVSPIQKKLILKYLESNPELLSPKFSINFKFKDAQIKWTEMANMLNRVPGSRKDWRQWRKTWHDMRSKTKLKHQQGSTVFSKSEKDILKLIGELRPKHHSINYSEMNIKNEHDDDSGNELALDQFLIENKGDPFDNVENNTDSVILEISPSEADILDGQKCEDSPILDDTNLQGIENDYGENAASAPFQKNFGRRTEKRHKSYYERKLIILDRIARAKEKSVAAKERIADALEKIAESRISFI